MGLETTCTVKLNRQKSKGAAHCGDGQIDFRGDFRFTWKWTALTKVEASKGILKVARNGEVAEFELGDLAEKWLNQIRNPKSRLDKLGLKPGHRYVARGEFDGDFSKELIAKAGEPAKKAPYDAIFIRLDSGDNFKSILKAREQIEPNGMIWTIWPKGKKELREDDIRNFALANGLVDVKVASFSETLSALKLVIPVALRPAGPSKK